MKTFLKYLGIFLLVIFVLGFFIPQNLQMPVEGADSSSYNHETFWYPNWGSSIVHRGVDIFAPKGTPIHAATYERVLYTGKMSKSGNYIITLGPKWRLHFYAHLSEIKTHIGKFVTPSDIIGAVGNTGNAANRPSHLHYSIATLIPYPWCIDNEQLGYLKMFYLNPIEYWEK